MTSYILGPEVHASVTCVGFTNDPHSLICRKPPQSDALGFTLGLACNTSASHIIWPDTRSKTTHEKSRELTHINVNVNVKHVKHVNVKHREGINEMVADIS